MLLIFQAMDAGGKDGVIKHVLSGVDPQGCEVSSFKAPSAEELDHDFLWRTTRRLPERGRIGVFNRSYYEEVLIVRVHPKLLGFQKLPSAVVTQADLARAVRGHQRVRASHGAQRLPHSQVLPPHLQGGAAATIPEAAGAAREALEVRARGRRRAKALGRLHAGLRGHDPAHEHAARAVDRRAGRQEVVCPLRRGVRASWTGSRA